MITVPLIQEEYIRNIISVELTKLWILFFMHVRLQEIFLKNMQNIEFTKFVQTIFVLGLGTFTNVHDCSNVHNCLFVRYSCQCWSRNSQLRTCISLCSGAVSSNKLWNSCYLNLGGKLRRQESIHRTIFVSEANLQDPSVRPSVRQSPFLKNLVTTTPPKRLDGLS